MRSDLTITAHRRARRLVWVLLGTAAAVLALAACEGLPDNVSLAVTTTADGSDAVPGDGICEVTVGAGDCSLRAAIDEANGSVARAVVHVPDGVYELDAGSDDDNAGGDLDLAPGSGALVIGADEGADVVVDAMGADGALDVRSGVVALAGIGLRGAAGPGMVVRPGATAAFGFATIAGNGGAGGVVEDGASLRLAQATVADNGGAGLVGGQLRLEFTTVTGNGVGGITGAGSASLAASIVADQASGSDCAHPVASDGANLASDASCGLVGPADHEGMTAGLGAATGDRNPVHAPTPVSPALDVLAPGAGLCVPGGSTGRDQQGTGRPLGTGCDAGAIELDGALALTVDTDADGRDAAPGDGACATAASRCTLRAAIDEANASPFADAITIGAGRNPILALAGADEDANASGDLDVVGDLTITGASSYVINGSQLDRVIDQRSGHLHLEGASVIRGRLTPAEPGGEDGAGLRVAGEVTLVDVFFRLNSSSGSTSRGGAIGVEAGGTLAMTRGAVQYNRLDGESSLGGGIASDGIVTLSGVTVELNGSGGSGGGIMSSTTGTLTVEDSIVRSNGVSAYGNGGGIASAGPTSITRSSLIANRVAASNGGALSIEGATVITDSTLAGNHAPGFGGAVNLSGASLTVIGSTISGNDAGSAGSAIYGFGGIFDIEPAPIQIRSSTVVGNAGANSIFSYPEPITLSGSAIAPAGGAACSAPAVSDGWNVVSDSTCALAGTGDQQGVPLLVGLLADNGGPTATRLPYANSPLVDVIPVGTPGLCAAGAVDQRGAARPVGTACDVGAVEGSAGLATPRSLLVTSAADLGDAVPGDGACVAAGGGCTLRAAIDEANAYPTADTVTIAPGVDPVLSISGVGEDLNQTGDLDIVDDLVLVGGGATIDGGGLDRVIHHRVGEVRLEGVTITGGRAGGFPKQGAGILSEAPLTVVDSTVTANVVDVPLPYIPGAGAGIAAIGSTLTVERSTISDNRSEPEPVVPGSALYVQAAAVTVTASTVSGNVGATAIELVTSAGPASVVLRASTVADNGGGPSLSAGNDLTLVGSVVAGRGGAAACAGPVTSLGWNVVADLTCATYGTGDRQGTNPALGPRGDNGGPTETHLPSTGSPLIDAIPLGTAGLCDGAATDQRGVARPVGSGCDVGATEGEVPIGPPGVWTVDSAADGRDASGDGVCDDGTGACTLRAAIDEANRSAAGDTITIAPGIDPVLSLVGADDDANAAGDLDVSITSGDLTIVGDGSVIDGSGLDRILDHRGGALVLEGLTLTDGTADAGAALRVDGGGATLRQVEVRDNTEPASGSAVSVRNGSLVIERSALIDIAGSTTVQATNSPITVRSSTLQARGAALSLFQSPATVRSSTLSWAAGTPSTGWLLDDISGSPIDLAGSVVADPGTVGGYSVCHGTIQSGGWNVASDSSCTLTAPTDVAGALVPLALPADNGGPTRTMLPAAGWAGVDAIPAGTPGLCDATVPVDQRGVGRLSGAGCDVGAVEGVGPPVVPGNYVVDSASDVHDSAPGDGTCATATNTCTLRAAVDEANANNRGVPASTDTVTIAVGIDPVLTIAGAGEDANAAGDLDVVGNLVLVGNGATVDGSHLDRVLDLRAPQVEVRSLTVTGGLVGTGATGGGIRSAGSLTLTGVVVEGNQAGGNGGGLAQTGPLEVADSVFRANTSVAGAGGGIRAESATIERSTITGNHAAIGGGIGIGAGGIVASTVSANTASSSGGGIEVDLGPVGIVNTTVSGNAAPFASGIESRGALSIATTITGSTIAGNTGSVALSTQGSFCNLGGCFTFSTVTASASILAGAPGYAACTAPLSGSFNLAPDGSCGASVAGAALLGALADNGGPTPTHLPGVGSAAIDAIPAGTAGLCDGTLPEDQRGVARPQGAACDIGAVEQ